MTGSLAVVGLGPGDARWLTPEAQAALAAADVLIGYRPYLERVPARPQQTRHPSDNREEGARAAQALRQAAEGARVAVVSGGDPGVFAMAAAICGEIEAAAEAGFVIALYNPISRARPWQLGVAFERLRRKLAAATPVVFGRAVGRADERVAVTTLAAADPAAADMTTLIIVGSPETRAIARPGRGPLVYTPR